jgi:hypothetical protein
MCSLSITFLEAKPDCCGGAGCFEVDHLGPTGVLGLPMPKEHEGQMAGKPAVMTVLQAGQRLMVDIWSSLCR